MSRTGNFIKHIGGSWYVIVLNDNLPLIWWTSKVSATANSMFVGSSITHQTANSNLSVDWVNLK